MTAPPWSTKEVISPAVLARGHHEVPELANRAGRQTAAAAHLLPADQRLAMLRGDGGGAFHEGEEVLRGGRERLVAAQVDVWPRGERREFANDVVDEPVGDVFADRQGAEADLRPGVELRCNPVGGELRIRGQGRVRVSRHVDFRDDRDVQGCRILDDGAVLLLRVEPAGAAAHLSSAADRGEVRPAGDLDPPALVVGQVQVQVVHLEGRELIEVALDVIDPEEVPGDVKHHAAVGVPRIVQDVDGRHRPHRSGRAEQLPQRLGAPEQPGRRICADPDALSSTASV